MGKASRRKRERRTVPIDSEVEAALRQQLELFRKKFGRDPGPENPVFFDPDAASPQLLDPDRIGAEIAEAMGKAGIEPAKIYAYRKTGLLVTRENWHSMSAADKLAWEQALLEYDERVSEGVKQ